MGRGPGQSIGGRLPVPVGLFHLPDVLRTLRTNKALMTVFGSLTILFWAAGRRGSQRSESFTRVAGWEGLFCGLSAMYLGIAQVLNESFGRTVLPIGPRR